MRSTAYALIYAASLPKLQNVAREHGYALAVHGSMATDLDLIAAPWVEDAVPAIVLIQALRDAIGGFIFHEKENDYNPTWKPHGRLAWSIYLQDGDGPYLDISVMPRRRDGEHYDNEDTREIEKKYSYLYEDKEDERNEDEE